MKIVLIFVLALGVFAEDNIYEDAFSTEVIPVSTDINEQKSFIVNGSRASEGQFPYQAGLLLKNTTNEYGWCSGSLIGKNWVITAAHCLHDLVSVKVNLGSIKRNFGTVSRFVAASCTISHSDYKDSGINSDIGLIWIPSVSYTKEIQPIKLPSIVPPYSDYAGSTVVISGWGLITNFSNIQPAMLRYAHFPVVNKSDCHIYVRKNGICVDTSKAGLCVGDSGSPLALVSNNLLVGVASYVFSKDCVVGKSAVGVRITSFLEWIKNETGIFY